MTNGEQFQDSLSKRPRVLVVAYVFPPAGGAGVQRVTKFVKYLPEFGWDCSVLTVSNPSVPVFDESLCAEIPTDTIIRRAKTLEPGYALKRVVSAGDGTQASSTAKVSGGWKCHLKAMVRSIGNAVLQPDAQVLWRPDAVRQGMRLLREVPHDAIFVTAPPFSSLLTAAELSRRSGLPLIVDYRDEWGISNNYQENRQKSRLSHWLQSRMQKSVLRRASGVVATTRRSAQSLRTLCRAAGSRARVTQIYNGYDAADLPSENHSPMETGTRGSVGASPSHSLASPSLSSASCSHERRLRLAYVGTLWNLTSIEPVVTAIKKLAAESYALAARIELVVAGRQTAEQNAILDRLNDLPCRVLREGYVSHQRALDLMSEADELLLLLSDLPEADRVVPAKTFEYLALKKPVLAVVPRGEVSELLEPFPLACSFAPSDVEGLTRHFRTRLEEPDSNIEPNREREAGDLELADPARFERRELTRQLAELLTEVSSERTTQPSKAGRLMRSSSS